MPIVRIKNEIQKKIIMIIYYFFLNNSLINNNNYYCVFCININGEIGIDVKYYGVILLILMNCLNILQKIIW